MILQDVINDPKQYFIDPFAIIYSVEFSFVEKNKMLNNWKFDSNRIAESSNESMGGGIENDLREVSKALIRLHEVERISRLIR